MITERTMQVGDWSLDLDPATPRTVRDRIAGFGCIVVMPTLVDVADMSDTALAAARYTGVITSPGPYYKLRGHSLAMYLGTSDRRYGSGAAASSAYVTTVFTNGTFSSVISGVLTGTGLTVGTLTDPSGGTFYNGGFWNTPHRVALDAACKWYDAEWRIRPNGAVDAARYDTLYGAPTAVITPRPGGRPIGGVGVEAIIDAEADLWLYASKLILTGKQQAGVWGGLSTDYRGFDGNWLTAVAEQPAPDLDGDVTFAASRIGPQMANAQRTVKVSSKAYDLASSIPAGARVYVYDPDHGVVSPIATPIIEWQGETIKPIAFRALTVTWPVQDGMSVFVRRFTGSGAVGTVEYVDLTRYIIPEDNDTTVEVGLDISMHWRP